MVSHDTGILNPKLNIDSEIRNELEVPSSGLDTVSLGDSFPPPPPGPQTWHSPGSSSLAKNAFSPSENLPQHEFEKSWFYFLAEVAIRRISTRIIDTFYLARYAEVWLRGPAERMFRLAKELEGQLEQWYVLGSFQN